MEINNFAHVLFQLVCFFMFYAHSQVITVSSKAATTTTEPESKQIQLRCDTPLQWFEEYSSIHPGILWPDGRITYNIEPDLSNSHIQNIAFAFKEYEDKTCLSFERRIDKTKKSVLNFELDDRVCAQAEFCYKGDYQFVKMSSNCSDYVGLIIHAIGHALCLPHEHQRWDRDNYVDFSQCTFPKSIPKKNHFDTKGYMYDFASVMHYQCSKCGGGIAKLDGVNRCGLIALGRLSVIDVDKINEMYGCQGCYRHRWRPTSNLTELDKLAMVPFGYNHRDNQPIYLCRAFVMGEISPGSYRMDKKICYVPFKMHVHEVKEHVQVFTLPPPKTNLEAIMYSGTYMTEQLLQGRPLENSPVPVGRTTDGVAIYAVMATVGSLGSKEKSIGKVYDDGIKYSYIPFEGKVKVSSDVDILVCRRGS